MEYLNLALTVTQPADGRYEVSARSDSMGEARGVLALSLDAPAFAAAYAALSNQPLSREAMTVFGGMLADALLAGDVRDLYRESLGRALTDDDHGLRVRLAIDPPALSALPWELLYDRGRDTFLATSTQTPLTRYITLHERIDELRTAPPVSVLVAIPDGSGLDVAMERALVEDALRELGDAVEVTVLDGHVTRTAISQALAERRHHIFHFIGHGEFKDDEGFAVLDGEASAHPYDLMPAGSFAGFFRNTPWMKLVVLNACEGAAVAATRPLAGMAPQLVRAGVPAVVAMQYPFADNAAKLFAAEFYRTLCTGSDRGRVDAAVSQARNRLLMDFGETLAFATPVLYMRSPSGVIFDLRAPARKRSMLPAREDRDRLRAVRQAHEDNVEALQLAGTPDAAAAIRQEKAAAAAITGTLRGYWLTAAGIVFTTWLVLFASWIGLFNVVRLDDRLEQAFVDYMDPFVATPLDPRLALVMASSDGARNGSLGAPSAAWRCHHAALLAGLTAAGARVVVFDLFFENASPCDEQLAAAIRAAADAGTDVVLGAEDFTLEEGVPRPVMTPALARAAADRWGILRGDRASRRIALAAPITSNVPSGIEARELGVVPSLALRTLMLVEAPPRVAGPVSAAVDAGAWQIRVRGSEGALVTSVPVIDDGMQMMVGMATRDELAPAPYHDVLADAGVAEGLDRFRGRIVVVGYAVDADALRLRAGDGSPRYGVEQQASAISNLLQGISIRPLRPLGQYAVILVMGLIGAAIAMRDRIRRTVPGRQPAPRFGAPLTLAGAAVVYALAAFLVYKQYRIIFDIGYHLASLLFAYWLVGRVRRGGTPTTKPKPA